MAETTQASKNDDQQPFLPSCSEATKTAPQSSDIPNLHDYSTLPNAPVDEFIADQMLQPQYPCQQTKYDQSSVPTASPYPPRHTENTYPQGIPVPGQAEQAPITVDVPDSKEPLTCMELCCKLIIAVVILAIGCAAKIMIRMAVKRGYRSSN